MVPRTMMLATRPGSKHKLLHRFVPICSESLFGPASWPGTPPAHDCRAASNSASASGGPTAGGRGIALALQVCGSHVLRLGRRWARAGDGEARQALTIGTRMRRRYAATWARDLAGGWRVEGCEVPQAGGKAHTTRRRCKGHLRATNAGGGRVERCAHGQSV